MNLFEQLLLVKSRSAIQLKTDQATLALCPDMGARIFAQLGELSLHRIDMEAVRDPDQPFANFGGANLWPAPEGGKFGFNYLGDQWYVPSGINRDPFTVTAQAAENATMEKTVTLTNRAGIPVKVRITRTVSLTDLPPELRTASLTRWVAYQTVDRFQVLNPVAADEALISAWTLDQHSATDETMSFGVVRQPHEAINTDFYQPPGDRIALYQKGFTYKTDGRCKGQIGLRRDAKPELLGFFDKSRCLLALKINRSAPEGIFFNIADNEQPNGPYSAADTYSIFNSDPDMAAFELETIGPLHLRDGKLDFSEVISLNAYAVFDEAAGIDQFLQTNLGQRLKS